MSQSPCIFDHKDCDKFVFGYPSCEVSSFDGHGNQVVCRCPRAK